MADAFDTRDCGTASPFPRLLPDQAMFAQQRIDVWFSLTACYWICATGTFPVGPIAVTCKITSPSLAHA